MNVTPNPVARRAAVLIGNTTATPEAIAAALDEAGLLARPTVEIPGPYPMYVRTTGLGAVIDVHPLVHALFRAHAAEFIEDPGAVGEELTAIAGASGPELDALLEVLLGELGGTEMRYGVTAARTLADRIKNAAGPVFPHQFTQEDAA
jgi:hypothetical protein